MRLVIGEMSGQLPTLDELANELWTKAREVVFHSKEHAPIFLMLGKDSIITLEASEEFSDPASKREFAQTIKEFLAERNEYQIVAVILEAFLLRLQPGEAVPESVTSSGSLVGNPNAVDVLHIAMEHRNGEWLCWDSRIACGNCGKRVLMDPEKISGAVGFGVEQSGTFSGWFKGQRSACGSELARALSRAGDMHRPPDDGLLN